MHESYFQMDVDRLVILSHGPLKIAYSSRKVRKIASHKSYTAICRLRESHSTMICRTQFLISLPDCIASVSVPTETDPAPVVHCCLVNTLYLVMCNFS